MLPTPSDSSSRGDFAPPASHPALQSQAWHFPQRIPGGNVPAQVVPPPCHGIHPVARWKILLFLFILFASLPVKPASARIRLDKVVAALPLPPRRCQTPSKPSVFCSPWQNRALRGRVLLQAGPGPIFFPPSPFLFAAVLAAAGESAVTKS